MASWTELVEASWQLVERSFDEQMYKTPPMSRPVVRVPLAPRKSNRPARRCLTLKPRRLDFEAETPSSQAPQDSGVSLWSGSSASLGPDDADKENRPLPRDSQDENIIPDSQPAKSVKRGSLRFKINRRISKYLLVADRTYSTK